MIDTLDIKVLMERLHNGPEPILRAIDEDPKLKKREREDGLIIANASKALPEPEHTHQLYAKGIVYTRDPWRVVSMPLLKMYNHGRREHCDAWTRELLERGAQVQFVEKVDGTMIQAFVWKRRIEFATRGMLEGMKPEVGYDYLWAVRMWAIRNWGEYETRRLAEGSGGIFEWVSPETRVVTDYGERSGLVLLYWNANHQTQPARRSLLDLDIKLECVWGERERHDWNSFEERAAQLLDMQDDPQKLYEGYVARLYLDGRLRHAVKLKTPSYLKYHRLKYHMSWKRFFAARLEDPEAARDDVWAGLGVEEEVEQMYEAYWQAWEDWKLGMTGIVGSAAGEHLRYYLTHPGATMKDTALAFKDHDHFHLIMSAARGNQPTLVEMARRYPPDEPGVGVA